MKRGVNRIGIVLGVVASIVLGVVALASSKAPEVKFDMGEGEWTEVTLPKHIPPLDDPGGQKERDYEEDQQIRKDSGLPYDLPGEKVTQRVQVFPDFREIYPTPGEWFNYLATIIGAVVGGFIGGWVAVYLTWVAVRLARSLFSWVSSGFREK